MVGIAGGEKVGRKEEVVRRKAVRIAARSSERDQGCLEWD